MKRLLATGLVLGAAALTGIGLSARRPAPSGRESARAAFELAVQARLAARRGEELDFLLAALKADPTYLAAPLELGGHPGIVRLWTATRSRLDDALGTVRDYGLRDCLRMLIRIERDGAQPLRLEPEASAAARTCAGVYEAVTATHDSTTGPDRRVLQLWQTYPQSERAARMLTGVMYDSRQWHEMVRIGRVMTDGRQNPLVRIVGYSLLVRGHAQLQDSISVRAARAQAAEAFVAAPPAVRHFLNTELNDARTLSFEEVAKTGDRMYQLPMLELLVQYSYEDGELATSERRSKYLLDAFAREPEVVSYALLFLGRTHLKAGRIRAAERDLLSALGATRDSADIHLVQVEHNLFHVYEALGRHEEALAAGRRYVERAQSKRYSSARMMAYHDLGWYLWRHDDHEQARLLLTRMLAMIDSLGMYRHYAGEYYERIGDLKRALELYDEAVAREPGDYRSVARRAVLAAQMGDTARARQLAELHDGALGPNYPEFTPQTPAILAGLGQHESAAAAAERAQRNARRRNQAAAVANLQLQRATLELELHAPARAAVLADSAAGTAARIAAFETQLTAQATRESARVRLGYSADSLVRIAARVRAERLPQLELTVQTLLGDALANRHQVEPALAAYARAAQLTDSLAGSFENDVDRARFRSASLDVSGKAIALIQQTGGATAVRRFSEWSIRRKARGVTGARAAAAIVPPRPALGEAIIDYVVLDTIVAALVVTSERSVLRVLPVSPEQVRQRVRALVDLLTPRIGAQIDVQRSSFDHALASSLYDSLVLPLLADLAGVTRLTIVPDGALHYLPFEALISQRSPGPKYLLERFTVQYAPSLAVARVRPTAVRGFVLALPGAAAAGESEVAAIAKSVSRALAVMPVSLRAASESTVRAHAARASVLHFATHAAPNDAAPPYAYLALQSDSIDDGRLHAFEIERLELNQALVVLSGCDTGRGYVAGGEGVLSLSRAFLRAGASATVATLWPVGSASSAIMTEFYRQLAHGRPPADALRLAKLHSLRTSHSSPLYWAAFVVIGA